MGEQMTGGLARGFRAAMALLLAAALSLPAGALNVQAYADEPMQPAAAAGAQTQALGGDESEIKIAVLSDMHYYPVNFVSDCEDYETYVGGDPKMLEESGSIADAALQMVREDNPDILLVSGDLTKDGEIQGHRDLASKFKKLEDETDIEVFVINGNHDLYNYTDACTFENGQKESAETTEQDDFKTIYANFGYNGDYNAQYFENPNAAQGELAGQMSYTVDLGKFRIVAIDSCCYSPDGGNGMGTNEHITAGRIDEDLMPWVVDQIKDAEEAGDTVIGLMHHGVVPHFQGEEDLLYEYVVDDWQNVATQFADAGMRYVFTGHMHANDITQYTSVSGNTITDLETGSLSSWMSPQRHVTITKGEALSDGTNRTKESFSVTSHSVKSIDFTDHNGQTQHIEDFRAYTQQKLYPETLFNNMANGMLRPILQEIGETGIRPWLAENLPDVDIDTMVLDVARDALAGGMEIELGTGVGRVSVSYRNNGIQLQPSGTAGWVLDDMTITDDQILRLVDGVLDIVETKYIENPDWLLGEIDKIVTKVSNMGITSLTDKEHSIYDLVLVVLTGHYAGCEKPPAWVESALDYIESGEIVQNLINTLKTDLMPIINTLLADNSIDTGIAFSGLWKTAIDTATDDGNLKATLDLFGFDEAAISELIDGLINEYLTPSFLTGMGSLISDVARSMLYDVNFTDDVIDSDSAVVIEFDGLKNAPDASVENGLLPTQVTMTLGADSENSRNFRWYTGLNVDSGTVQVATDSGFSSIVAEADASREEVVKPKTRMNLGLITTYGTQEAAKYSASVTGLDDGATYYYRVGDKDANLWSAAYQFATGDAADGDDAFTFINVNDSQGMVESDYDVYLNTLAQADVTFPTAAFTIHAGDFVDDGANEDYWTWALDDEDGVAQGMAMTPAAGNHEAKSEVEGITDANPIVSHFNLANVPQGQDLSTGVYYSYVYKNATFVVLNTNDLEGNSLSSAQYNWAYDTLANADTEWKIVLMHKSPYSNGPHQADDDVLAIRSQINSLAAATDVDVVLSGHDHVYNRTPYLAHGNEQDVTTETQNYEGVNYETALNPSGTVFVIAGTCGVKNYVQTPSDSIPSEVSLDLSVPVFTGITIDGDHLYYRAYKVEGGGSALVDSFAISKAEEDVAPAWKQVEDLIAALPEQSEVTIDNEPEITAARAAYDELSAEDQQKVSNYDRLVAAERMLSLLQNVAGKRTVTVRNSGGLKTALEDSTVGTINVEGEIDSGEGLFTNGDRELYVTHDKVIGGTGKLTIFKFHVQNGATLVLKDSVYIDNTRTQGSTYRAWNPIEVHANSTLITQNDVSLRTEYGSGGSEEGVAVKLMESGATAILGSSGSYWGAEAAVLSTASGTTLVINDGTYNAKNNNRVVVDTHGDATVNGGTISSMWISGTLRVNGGSFEHQDSASSNWTPLAVSGGNAYITGGTFSAFSGRDGNASIKLENNAKLHVLADTNGAVKIGSATPYVGSPSTSDYKNVKLGYVKSNGWNNSDGIYRVEGSVSASSVEDIAGLSASRLDTKDVSNNGNYMEAVLPDGTSTVFGKYWIYGGTGDKGAPSGSGIIGSGDVIVYGPTRIIQNNPVTGVTIDGEDLRVVDLREEGADTLRLNGYTTPADAFDNGITWSSDNKQTAKVEESAGQGVVTLDVPGGATITATSVSKPDLSDSVEIIAVEPEFVDTVEEIAWNQEEAIVEASAGFSNDTYKKRISFKYSTDNNSIATFEPEVDPETGEAVSELQPGTLRKISRGTVKVTAELLVDGKPTGITVSKDVFCDAAPEAPTYGELAELLNVTVADGNEAMAEEHTAQTFDLIENASEQTDSYSVGAVSASDQAPANPIDALANFMGLDNARSVWTVDVTVNAAPYAKAFDEKLGLAPDTHTVDEGDAQKTVKLVWNIGDDQADPTAETGWALENEDASPVQFQAKCTSYKVDFKYVGEDWASVVAPEPVNVLAGAKIGDKLPAPEREGFTFVGWYKDWKETDGFKDENLVTSASTVGADTTLYGRWAVGAQAMNAYVVFDPSGGAFAEDDETPEVVPVELTSGADYVASEDVPANPSLANHMFDGWYYKAVSEDVPDGTELPFDANVTEIVGNLHVYAKWNEKPQVEIAAGDNDFTYNGEAQAFRFSVKSDGVDAGSFTVEYRPADSDDDGDWSSQTVPTDAGEYDVRITRGEYAAYASFEQVIESAVKIGKAPQAMPELAVQGGAESAIIKVSGDAANGFEWDDNERFESAADVSDVTLPAAGPGTYFVRAKEADNHAAGAIAQVSVVKVDFSAGEGSLPETTHNAWLIGAGQAVGEDGMPADPTREGYEFAGWKMGEADFDAGTVVSQSASVAAAWTAKTFTVNFDADGGVFEGDEGAPIKVTYDENWPELSTPTKTGMNFNGWWLGEGEDAVRIISGTPVKITGNATLKAQWTDKVAIVVTVGQENEFVYDGVEHSFSYTTDPEGVKMTVEYRPAAGESDEEWSPALPVDAGAYDVRLTHVEDETYAEFSAAIGHVLVIDKADQTLPEQFFSASTFGDYVLVTFSSADMVGNLEWANNEGFVDAAEVTQGDTFEVRSEGAYYLRFKGDANHNPSPSASFTVVKATFDVGEGVLSQGDKAAWLIQSGTTLGGNLPEASREGYRFDGWFAGETQIGAETQINDSIAAAAKWTANTYTVTFDADGGTLPDGAQSAITVTYDQQWPELPEPTMTGKFFQGWFLDDAEVSAGATVKIIGDTTLTAHWGDKQAITVTPTQDANSFTYDGEPHAFAYAVDPEGVTGLTVEYAAVGVDDWSETAPTNADTYDVRVTRDEDDTYAAYEQTFEGGLVIAKADGAAAPELGVTADAEGAMIAFEPAEGVDYEYADNTDFAEAKDVEDGGFQATEPGTWYVRAKGDANHEPGEAAGVQIAKVTFDAASGTVEGSVAWFLKSGESVGEGNLPTATREGFEFAGWTVDGEPFDGTTPVIGDIIAIAGWSEVGDEPGPDEPQAPAAPVADEVATLEGVTVTLNGVNEINSDEGNKTHPDVTFASVGEDVQPLIAKSFTIGQPAETDGVWTVEVTMDAQKYLDAYAAMGDPAYGAHYFANADEDGVETFALTYDADARAWVLANAQQAAFAYDITCLTLRPAEAEIYTGGTSENGGHFIDQYVVDGQGNVVSIDELNERLDEGVTASIKYYDADGNEVTDDTVAGHYIARIDVSAAEAQARAAAIDDTVEVNVGGREYTFNLEPSELVIRSVSDAAEAERGDLNVALVDGSDAQAVATALGQAQGGVVAALPGETTILFNGNPEVEIADRSDITLLSDDLLPGGREDALLARVQEVLGADALADNTDFQYLDLVDRSQSNAWVSSTAGTQVFWRIPEGADTGSIKILHFVDLHRDYTMADEDVVDLIAGCDVEAMSLMFDEENGFVSFAVPEGGFSPFLMTWNDAVDDPDDPDQPGTDPDQPGTDPDQPGADPEDPDQPAQKVTVTFDANGGQLSTGTPGSVEIAAGGTIAMLPWPVRTGYAFVGWTTADGTAFDITTPVNESMTVIAQWRPIVYQISLDAQGGALAADEASIEVTFDAPIGKLPVPTREGYEFLGWFTQPQGGDEVTAETMYRTAGPSTYYAQWDVLPATQVVLTLDANGGMFQGGQETIAEVVAINAPLHSSDLTVPQREGFELAGWYLDESLTQPVVLVEDADPDAGIVATTFAQDATLYAKWLEDLSSDVDISFGGILQAYTGSAMPGVPTFGESFPNDERTKVQVLYRASLMRANEWTDQAPINVGTYDVRFVYEGSGEYAAFAKDYPAGITITKATLAQVGLTVDTPEVEAGTKLADVSLEGATVTSQVTGAVIEGIWAWLDADGVIDETGAYQAVFVPADAENFEPLHVEIQLTVKEAGADKPGGSDEPTDPTDPGLPGTDPTDPDNQPGAGTGTDTGSGSGTGAGTGAGTGSSSDGADGRNQMKLVATGDPVAGIIVGFGAVLLAALITGLVALRNTRRKN